MTYLSKNKLFTHFGSFLVYFGIVFIFLYVRFLNLSLLVVGLTFLCFSLLFFDLKISLFAFIVILFTSPVLKVYSNGFSLSFCSIAIIIPKLILYIYQTGFLKKFINGLIRNTLFFVMLVLSLLVTFILNSTSSIDVYLKVLIFLLCYYVVASMPNQLFKNCFYSFFSIEYFVLFFVILCSYFLLYVSNDFKANLSYITATKIRSIDGFYRLSGFNGDPNIFCFLLLLVFILINRFETNCKLKSISCCFIVLLIVLSVSFTGYIAFFLYSLFDLFENIYKKRKKLKFLTFLPISAFLLSILLLLPIIIKKGDNGDAGVSSGRIDLYKTYFAYLSKNLKNFIFGLGINAKRDDILFASYCHNFVIDTIYDVGFIGLLFYVLFLVSPYFLRKRYFKNNKNLIPIIVFSMLIPMNWSIYLFSYLCINIILLSNDFSKGEF